MREGDFELEDDNAFYVKANTIQRREGGQESQLSMKDDIVTFENAQVHISLSPDFAIKEMTLKEAFAGTLSLKSAAEMALILKGVSTALPFLMA